MGGDEWRLNQPPLNSSLSLFRSDGCAKAEDCRRSKPSRSLRAVFSWQAGENWPRCPGNDAIKTFRAVAFARLLTHWATMPHRSTRRQGIAHASALDTKITKEKPRTCCLRVLGRHRIGVQHTNAFREQDLSRRRHTLRSVRLAATKRMRSRDAALTPPCAH